MTRTVPTRRRNFGLRLTLALLALCVAVVSFGGAPTTFAQENPLAPFLPLENPPVVRGVEIEGLQRIDRVGVRSKIYTQIGRDLDQSRLSEDIKRIYAMSFFDDIVVRQKPHPDGGITLVFQLVERPTIVSIQLDIDGDAVGKDDVQAVVDLQRFEVLDEAKIRFNLSKIEELYIEEGHFLAETSYTLVPQPSNGVLVTLVVREGRKVEVRHVTIVGNSFISSEEIKGILATREGGYFSFLTQSGQFKREIFEQDVQRISLYYLTKGFVQVRVDDPVVSLSPDKRSMSIAIKVTEGPRFKTGKLDVTEVIRDPATGKYVPLPEDDWLIPREQLTRSFSLKPGTWFDYQLLEQDRSRIGARFKDLGYANANVTIDNDVDSEARTFGVNFRVQRGEPVYIRRIEVLGNRSTRDKVIRREMKIAEGELYSSSKIARSRQRIGVLGFFEGVDIDTRPTTRPDQIDLVVKVREKQTGTFQVGAGFSSLESFILTAQIAKENFLGRGQTVSAQLTLSAIRQLYSISFFEPYFLESNWTFAFDLHNFQEEFVDFTRLKTGGNLSFGYRLTDDLSLSLTYTLEDVDATLRRTDIDVKKLRQSGLTSSLRGTISFDTRNNRLFPSEGQWTTGSVEVASSALGSENEYVRLIGQSRWYFPLFWDFVLRINGKAGYVVAPDGATVPLFERFFVGGIFTLRGFERNSIGEKLYLTGSPDGSLDDITIGGDKEFILNAEIEFPIFKEVQIRGVLFFDAGNAWGENESFNPFDLRTSVGFGLRWNSPVGPLRFEWGFPLAPRPGEDPLVFEFTIGNSF
ncbi:MAG: outer membrane protein insertion porin family [Myxococcota bacterium]